MLLNLILSIYQTQTIMILSHKGMHEQNESSSARQLFLQKGLCQDSDWLSKHAGAWDVGGDRLFPLVRAQVHNLTRLAGY